MSFRTTLAFALSLGALAGCATKNTASRNLAERELGCPASAIHLEKEDTRIVRATGCGESVRITCHDPQASTGAAKGWADPLTAGDRVICDRILDRPSQAASAPAEKAKTTKSDKPIDLDRTFDKALAAKLLGASAERARSCRGPSGPTGAGRARITFAADGTVSAVDVGAPYADTEAGRCVARELSRVSLTPFDGEPVTVTKSFEVDAR